MPADGLLISTTTGHGSTARLLISLCSMNDYETDHPLRPIDFDKDLNELRSQSDPMVTPRPPSLVLLVLHQGLLGMAGLASKVPRSRAQ